MNETGKFPLCTQVPSKPKTPGFRYYSPWRKAIRPFLWLALPKPVVLRPESSACRPASAGVQCRPAAPLVMAGTGTTPQPLHHATGALTFITTLEAAGRRSAGRVRRPHDPSLLRPFFLRFARIFLPAAVLDPRHRGERRESRARAREPPMAAGQSPDRGDETPWARTRETAGEEGQRHAAESG